MISIYVSARYFYGDFSLAVFCSRECQENWFWSPVLIWVSDQYLYVSKLFLWTFLKQSWNLSDFIIFISKYSKQSKQPDQRSKIILIGERKFCFLMNSFIYRGWFIDLKTKDYPGWIFVENLYARLQLFRGEFLPEIFWWPKRWSNLTSILQMNFVFRLRNHNLLINH